MGRGTTLIINELQWCESRVEQVAQPGHKQTQGKITDTEGRGRGKQSGNLREKAQLDQADL